MQTVEIDIKKSMLVFEAERWIGWCETGGDNKGEAVQAFQKAVDGKAQGEPWCMAFVQFCLKMVDEFYDVAFQKCSGLKCKLKKSESVMDVWQNASADLRSDVPQVGSIICWQYLKDGKPTNNGHTGIVTKIVDESTVETIEGNTSDSSRVEREGDGVYRKNRSWRVTSLNSSMICRGFLKPWG